MRPGTGQADEDRNPSSYPVGVGGGIGGFGGVFPPHEVRGKTPPLSNLEVAE